MNWKIFGDGVYKLESSVSNVIVGRGVLLGVEVRVGGGGDTPGSNVG